MNTNKDSIGIYKITSPSGKIYIGQSINILSRWKKYFRLDCNEQPKILRSLKKYGPENHKFEIIEECIVGNLDEREIFWGNYYNVLNKNGLNCRLGSGKGTLSKETKNKMGKAKLGQKRTQETKNKMSKSHLGKQYKLGFIVTQETKNKISEKPTQILCVETGQIFRNTKHTSKEMNISHVLIWRVCKGIKSKAKGYTFKFVNDGY